MMNYYDELISQIETLITNKEHQQALAMIQEELNMPYVPKEVLLKLEAYEILCQQTLKQKQPKRQLDFEDIAKGLFLDDFSAMNSIVMMSDLNLRNYIEECQDVLNRLSNPVLVGLVILQLTQQNIDHEFTLQKPGLTFSFYPVYVEAPNESDGYQIASRYFQEELFKEPQFENLCQELLIQEALSYLPLSYSEEEGLPLAYSLIKKGFLLSNRSQEWYDYAVRNDIDDHDLVELVMDI